MNAEYNLLSIERNLIQSVKSPYMQYRNVHAYGNVSNSNKLELTPGNKTPIAWASSNIKQKVNILFLFLHGSDNHSFLSACLYQN